MKYRKNPTDYCFVAGTIVATVLGFMAIDAIMPGDYVLAKDMDTGIVSYEPVLQTFVREVEETYTITIDGEEIETTAEHPFYVEDEGFVEAQNLKVGDQVETSDRDTAEVESVRKNELDEPVLVYNFEVMDDHTYYVGETGVLVHNKCDGLNVDGEGGTNTGNQVIDNMQNRVPNNEITPPNNRGNAPLSNKDGKPIEIHHSDQEPLGPFKEMHPSDHRYGANYKNNHPNYNSKSKIDRTQFRKWKQEYWENEWDNGRWNN